MTVKNIRLSWGTLITDSATDEFFPLTGWMPAGDIEQVRVAWEIASIGGAGTTTVTPAYQPANFADTPGTSNNIGTGTSETTKDVFYPDTFNDISTVLKAAQIVRFGFHIKSSSGTGWAQAGGVTELQMK